MCLPTCTLNLPDDNRVRHHYYAMIEAENNKQFLSKIMLVPVYATS